MKNLCLVAILAMFSFSASATVKGQYGQAGCGLGAVLLGDRNGAEQIFASTLNGFMGNQTFGISFGTLNCTPKEKKASAFIEANKSTLESEIAQSQGETLTTLAKIYKIKNVKKMTKVLNKNHKFIFSHKDSKKINNSIAALLVSNNLM